MSKKIRPEGVFRVRGPGHPLWTAVNSPRISCAQDLPVHNKMLSGLRQGYLRETPVMPSDCTKAHPSQDKSLRFALGIPLAYRLILVLYCFQQDSNKTGPVK